MKTRSLLLKRLEPETVEELAADLRSPNQQTRLYAARELAGRGEAAVEALLEALEDPDEQVWQIAFAALVKIGDPAIAPLMTTMEHPKHSVGLMAAAVLLRMGIPASSTPRLYVMQQELLQEVQAQAVTSRH